MCMSVSGIFRTLEDNENSVVLGFIVVVETVD
jgi:hypothetical protein